ncbi:RAMP superfamily CRISPR-associated protein [Rhodospirillum rubrum]|uniref:CRISPR type III-associated protein domain-containing protein n=1 Tax=Rhodospirillum rubrum (strain ATCC 11170 / ATH 1.1.1 / DSM 467 / LMG 4362 / NCIMB 8255 / S1) TaxID=269796 RepID=Q2RY05_RHORT|nr:RAMP superfamily CRISPR-associated protein [Rhodospirillum rubrum]ABC20990.1 hypothetical protein Rru_A0185 [Rhodospirillum rubrum ATCC 11170]AEO46655.1 hypothetical protein F11_00925 [Rhodospirillum rubrum F11]QXG80687.1 hypothetical protein KUL73_00980 [Rhodospirillum rubrum]HAQ01189.1 hypothetical protein [Rhodospirillum rubrum]HCF19279.1 hypothetical protein [Rhodospirillum rubrum]
MIAAQAPIRHHRLTIDLTVQAPVLVHATGMGRPGLDSPTLRNARKQIILPGTLVHGRVRTALTELGELAGVSPDDCKAWFGAEGQNRHQRAKAVVFDDFICTTAPNETERSAGTDEIVRIRLDQESGAVQRGMLQVIEAPFPVGQQVTFEGHVRVAVGDDELSRVCKAIRLALAWNTQVGALRTLGFGRVLSVSVGDRPADEPPAPDLSDLDLRPRVASDADPEAVTMVLRFHQPLCVPARTLSNNLFVSDTILSGATLKGAIAAQWSAALGTPSSHIDQEDYDSTRPHLSAAFARLRVGSFLPVALARPEGWSADRMRRPVALPLTLGAAGDDTIRDLRTCEPDTVFQISKTGETFFSAPRFAPDWKDDDVAAADRARGWHEPDKDLRVRTSIDHERRRSEDSKLFAYETVLTDKHQWIGEIGLNDASPGETERVLAELKDLLGETGLWWVGKTKAGATVTWCDGQILEDHLSHGPVTGNSVAWRLVLQTPALMLGPDLSEDTDAEALFKATATYWSEASEGAVRLTRHWSRQHLWGGAYAAHSYQANHPYRPFLLTDPGAVFCLEAADGQDSRAREYLTKWRRQGLPLTRSLADHYGLGADPAEWWQGTPFVPENGYGVIHLDPALPKTMPLAQAREGVVEISMTMETQP